MLSSVARTSRARSVPAVIPLRRFHARPNPSAARPGPRTRARRKRHRCRERTTRGLRLRGVRDDLQFVAQPLHRRSRDEHATFHGELRRVVRRCRARRQQAIFRYRPMFARVHQRETSGAVSVFRQSRGKASLAEQRRLLIARDARDRDRRAQVLRSRRFRKLPTTARFSAASTRADRRSTTARDPNPRTRGSSAWCATRWSDR